MGMSPAKSLGAAIEIDILMRLSVKMCLFEERSIVFNHLDVLAVSLPAYSLCFLSLG
jgi:hypothetical protein